MYLHCQSICQVAPHNGAESLKPEVHYPGSLNHSRNTDWRTYKQVGKHRHTFIFIHKKKKQKIVHTILTIAIYSLYNATAAYMANLHIYKGRTGKTTGKKRETG